jgi:hypothetical protein
MMNIITSEQTMSFEAHMASKGSDSLSSAVVTETTLDELISWLRTQERTTLDISGGDIVISKYNSLGIEVLRTTIACNNDDRDEIIRALEPMVTAAA